MLHLHSNKIITLFIGLVLTLTSINVVAQRKLESLNYAGFKDKPYYFGLALGYAHNDYRISRSDDFILNEEYLSTKSISGPGFTIGVIGNLKIGDYFDIRFVPGFSFSGRDLVFKTTSGEIIKENIQSTFLEAPFMVRYKSEPYSDMRIFLLAGVKYTYDISNYSRVREDENLIQLSPHDYLLEAGIGVQFFFPYFILSPEIKFSQGLDNILIYKRNLGRSQIFEQILTQTITFTLNFEG